MKWGLSILCMILLRSDCLMGMESSVLFLELTDGQLRLNEDDFTLLQDAVAPAFRQSLVKEIYNKPLITSRGLKKIVLYLRCMKKENSSVLQCHLRQISSKRELETYRSVMESAYCLGIRTVLAFLRPYSTRILFFPWEHTQLIKKILTLQSTYRDPSALSLEQFLEEETPLMKAAQEGYSSLVWLFLTAGAQCDTTNGKGETALMYAAINGHLECVRMLIEAKALYERKYDKNQSVLMLAAGRGYAEVVRYLLTAGAQWNVVDDKGLTPLLHALKGCACKKDDPLRTVQVFLNARPSATATDPYGNTAIHYAASAGLVDPFSVTQCSHCCGSIGQDFALQALALFGLIFVDLGVKNSFGETPLMLATERNLTWVVRWLIDNDDSLDAQDNWGETALLKACRSGYYEIVDQLLTEGASTTIRDCYGRSPLMQAVALGSISRYALCGYVEKSHFGPTYKEVVKLLLNAGARCYTRDKRGTSVLEWADKAGDVPIIELIKRTREERVRKILGCTRSASTSVSTNELVAVGNLSGLL